MPLPRRFGYYSYKPVIDCEYKPCFNDEVCCSATKPFKDKYCEEQRIWRLTNCCPCRKTTCCRKWDRTEEMCSRFYNVPNYSCVKNRNYKENNKTMQALTTCGRRTCLTRDCSGPYYSMTGPVYHPPGLICQDYSLYIPTERVLEHCKCKGNHHCKKLKRLRGRCWPCNSCCIPIGDNCCDMYQCCPNPQPCCNYPCEQQQQQQHCLPTGDLVADIQNFGFKGKINQPCCECAEGPYISTNDNNCTNDASCFQDNQQCTQDLNQMGMSGMVTYDPPRPDDCSGAVPCGPCNNGGNEMARLLEEFKHKWNYSDRPNCKDERRLNRNPILGVNIDPILQTPQIDTYNCNCNNDNPYGNNMVCTNQPHCDCAACRRQEIQLNGNHYTNCTCPICQRRRGCGGFVAPKITDRKAERCRRLWMDNQREPCQVDPFNSDKTVQNPFNMNSDATTVECTNSIDCPCPACCRKRQYSRIKPYSCYSNGMTNPDIELKKMSFPSDENNNEALLDKNNMGMGRKSKGRGKSSGKSSSNPSGSTTLSNSVTDYNRATPTSDTMNNNNPLSQDNDQPPKINVEPKQINYGDQDITNVEYYTGDCQQENPCRKSFGLDVTYKILESCKNECDCPCQNGCPSDPCQNPPCPFPDQSPNPYCCEPVECESSFCKYPNFCRPAPRLRCGQRRCIPASTADDDDDCCNNDNNDDGCNGDANDYNTTEYRENFRRARLRKKNRRNSEEYNPNCTGDFRPDDDGWCDGKPRYRRGRGLDLGCQNHLLRSDTFSIFDNMFKPVLSSCRQCEEECLQRTCHDRACKMPYSMELRRSRWPAEDDGLPTCCCECGMLDRYCNTCDQTF